MMNMVNTATIMMTMEIMEQVDTSEIIILSDSFQDCENVWWCSTDNMCYSDHIHSITHFNMCLEFVIYEYICDTDTT